MNGYKYCIIKTIKNLLSQSALSPNEGISALGAKTKCIEQTLQIQSLPTSTKSYRFDPTREVEVTTVHLSKFKDSDNNQSTLYIGSSNGLIIKYGFESNKTYVQKVSPDPI
jgi:hypothetical protein